MVTENSSLLLADIGNLDKKKKIKDIKKLCINLGLSEVFF